MDFQDFLQIVPHLDAVILPGEAAHNIMVPIERLEIFKKIESEIFTEIENNEHSKIFYKFINLYFNIENWIKDNKESMPARNRT